jgi:predicted metal-dependent hydrolase
MSTIFIVESNKINAVFVKANSALLKKYKENFQKASTIESKLALLIKYWEKEYKATLIKQDDVVSQIEFKNSKDLTLFSLRWS